MNSSTSPWKKAGRSRPRVVVIVVPGRASVLKELDRLQPVIATRADIVAVDLNFSYPFTDEDVDFVVVLGGDGSILQSARQMGPNQHPVLGINCGQLGFLAALSPDDFVDIWPDVCAGQVEVVDHLMMRTVLRRNDQMIADCLGLNETAILGGPPFQIMDVDMYVDGLLATTYRCDGLIISTPVGSTAHNLSAGGPILRKNLSAFVVSPISPHTLTYRPVVDTADRIFELAVTNPNDSTSVVVDGRVLSQIETGDRVEIRRAKESFQMLSVPGNNDYRTLREKLNWGGNTLPMDGR